MSKAKSKVDIWLLIVSGLLLVIGLAVLWSASTAEAKHEFGDTNYYIIHQLTRGVLIGLVSMYIFSKIDYHRFKKPAGIFAVGGLLILLALKIPGLGFTANGATRWIDLGPVLFQPSEFAKIALIIYLAAWTSDHNRVGGGNFWNSIFPPLLLVVMMAGLIVFQPDLGTALAIISISFLMLFVGGARLKYLAWTAVAGVIGVLTMIIFEPYRMRRITAFLNPEADTLGVSYQINQALIAIGSGGLFGYGYGLSRQKHFYLPEAINDSIFAVMAEELGFFRVSVILALFAWFVFRGIQIAMRAPDSFGKMLAIGLTALFGVSVIINVGAITGLIPLTGIALPLFSYGSSAMIVNLSAIGILLNISKQGRET